jgi:hypothetical protein
MPNKRRPNPRPLVAGLVALMVFAAGCGSSPSAAPNDSPGTDATLSPALPSASPSATPVPTPTPSPTPQPSVAIVPVANFRTAETSVDGAAVAAVLDGNNKVFTQLEFVASDADAILSSLGLDASSAGTKVVLAQTAAALATDLAAKPSRLGLIRADQVGPGVRALAWGGVSLFGVARVRTLADWPLQAKLGAAAGPAFDPAQIWTMAAAGDMMLDRGVYTVLVTKKKGADYPFDGGTVKITTHWCCTPFDWSVPRSVRTTTTPDVRNLISGADLAMANLEGPAPVTAGYHSKGMSFTFQQSLLVGIKNAGIDVVSLANNHIANAGRQGIVQTVAALDKLGIAHGGAGSNSKAARAPALFTIDGVKVAFLGYAAAVVAATSSLPGGAPLSSTTTAADIRAARAAGAQVVIVFPHWGNEYKAAPTSGQRSWAHTMIDAGADLVIGSHSHWSGAMEVYKGKPIWYSLGNFVFDQSWMEQTEEGLILELSFSGTKLVQAWIHPTLLLDNCQPNFLDKASGKVVLDQVFNASKRILPW